MMSNDKISGIVRLLPVETVIVDEASQIEIGDYIPMMSLFHRTLKKIVFIGDDKQRLYFLSWRPPFSDCLLLNSGTLWSKRSR
jgi:hypothetical protein